MTNLSPQEQRVYDILKAQGPLSSADIAIAFYGDPLPINAQQRIISFLRFVGKKLDADVTTPSSLRLHKKPGKKDGPGRPHHVFWLAAR